MQGLVPEGYDRFDICDGYYWWLADHHEGQASEQYKRLCKLDAYYTPHRLEHGPCDALSREVYDALCKRHGCKGLCRAPEEEETEIYTWFERDRAHVELRDMRDKKTLVEWWNEAVKEAVEDGFLSPKDWHGTAYTYWHATLR